MGKKEFLNQNNSLVIKSLVLKANAMAFIDISVGLEIHISAIIIFNIILFKEVFMKNSIANMLREKILEYVWCGIALLRSPWWYIPAQREIDKLLEHFAIQEYARRFESLAPPKKEKLERFRRRL